MKAIAALLLTVWLAPSATSRNVRITLLATTDVHGNIYPYDYFTAQPAARGLAKIAKIVEAVRAENPNTLLVDCGDSIQGTPMEAVYQYYVRTGRMPLGLKPKAKLAADPVMLAMNQIRYDAMVLGNHEFNYGLKNLDRARRDAKFPWLSANTRVQAGSEQRPFDGYIVKSLDGVKVAIVGATTPSIPMWEEKANYRGYEFATIVDAVQKAVDEVRAKHSPNVVIVAAHSGLGRDVKTGQRYQGDLPGENAMYDVATKVKGVDAIVFGHTHQQLPSHTVNGVLIMQPKNWAMSLGRMDFVVDDSSGKWIVQSKTSDLMPVKADGPVDEAILALTKPHQDAAEMYLRTPVAKTQVALSAALARVEDTALVDAIHQVQLAETKADVSFASSFNPRVRIPEGPVSVRDIAAMYLYENTLLAIEGTGKMVREALENSATYFVQCTGDCANGPLINRRMPGFNYDMAQGVEYEIDISRAPGERIRNLKWRGRPLADDQPLRIAINNYRAGGSGGYTMFRDAKVVWRSNEEIRELIIRYYTNGHPLPAEPDRNWKVLPASAAVELRREALAESQRNFTQ
jgi:2',3'-cyclic-nucleotide 2'-phosphodiesterase/3'-nucleotidase